MLVTSSAFSAACSCGGCGSCQTRLSVTRQHQVSSETNDASSEKVAPGNDSPAAAKAHTAQPLTDQYTPAEQEQIDELKARDREVRAHEAAHKAAAGAHARGGASYTYQRGPDGARYAIGGEVKISLSPIAGDPEATIRKAQQIRAAALAPAEPSSQDFAVAAQAAQMALQAQSELSRTKGDQAVQGVFGTESSSDTSPHTDTPKDGRSADVLKRYDIGDGQEPARIIDAFA